MTALDCGVAAGCGRQWLCRCELSSSAPSEFDYTRKPGIFNGYDLLGILTPLPGRAAPARPGEQREEREERRPNSAGNATLRPATGNRGASPSRRPSHRPDKIVPSPQAYRREGTQPRVPLGGRIKWRDRCPVRRQNSP